MTVDAKKCPICNKMNHCGNELGESNCWCSKQLFPKEMFKLVPNEKLDKSCICKECLVKFK